MANTRVTITVNGREGLLTKLKQLEAAVTYLTFEQVNQTLLDTRNDAQRHTPIRTGTLLQGFQIAQAVRTGNVIEGFLYNVVDYAPYVELGTRFMKAQPYFYPAWGRNARRMPSQLGQRIRKWGSV